MAYSLMQVSEIFWSPTFWLPTNLTWHDLQSAQDFTFPHFNCVIVAPLFSIVMMFVRSLLERYVFIAIAVGCGLTVPRFQIVANELLEKAYRVSGRGKLSTSQVQGLAKQMDWSEQKVERWIYRRGFMDEPSDVTKITESGWKLTYHLSALILGVYVLWDKPWLWDFEQFWIDYPKQSVTPDVTIYYMTQLSYYWSSLLSHFRAVRRKDFLAMFVHHVVSIFLISLSWTVNMVRAGSTLLLIHELADVSIETAKLSKYTGHRQVCTVLLVIFSIIWLVTRVSVFPFYYIRSLLFVSTTYFDSFPAFKGIVGLLFVIHALHVFWTYFLFKVLHRALFMAKLEDARSSSELSECESSVEDQKLKCSPFNLRN